MIIEKDNTHKIAIIQGDEVLITDAQSALDLIMTVQYDTGYNKLIIDKSAIVEDFFQLSTCLAGEVIQKFVNYHFNVAITGDFSVYTSKSLRDFIRETNKGNSVFFVNTLQEAVDKLAVL